MRAPRDEGMIHRAFSWRFSSFPRSSSFVSIFYICTLEVAEIAVLHAAANRPISRSTEKTVADPDPQMGGGGEEGRSSRPGDKGAAGTVSKKSSSALRASVWSKNKVGARALRAPSLEPPLRDPYKPFHVDRNIRRPAWVLK